MKSTIIAAAALLGSATAEIQKLKLQKVPLEEQLVGSLREAPHRTTTDTASL